MGEKWMKLPFSTVSFASKMIGTIWTLMVWWVVGFQGLQSYSLWFRTRKVSCRFLLNGEGQEDYIWVAKYMTGVVGPTMVPPR